MRYTVRPAQSQDAEQIATLISESGHDVDADAVRGRLETLLSDPQRQIVLVGESGASGILGYLHVRYDGLVPDGDAEIDSIVVDPDLIEGKLASELLAAAQKWARREGCRGVRVTSLVFRQRPRGRFRQMGFKVAREVVLRKKV